MVKDALYLPTLNAKPRVQQSGYILPTHRNTHIMPKKGFCSVKNPAMGCHWKSLPSALQPMDSECKTSTIKLRLQFQFFPPSFEVSQFINIRPNETVTPLQFIFYNNFRFPGLKNLSSIRSSCRIKFSWTQSFGSPPMLTNESKHFRKQTPKGFFACFSFSYPPIHEKTKAVSKRRTKELTITKQ